MKLKLLLAAYAITNAILYSAMLPLWEGFDEPFHFGYVQRLANGQGFPDPRTTFLSREVASSLSLAPASAAVRQNLPQVTTYSEYFSFPRLQRAAIQRQLRDLPPDSRLQNSGLLNYEAHQAPLAYIALALPERALARIALPARVLALRIIGALIGTFLLYFGARRLFAEVGLRGPPASAALFCVFSCQMTWATVAHVANDWLAVPLAVWSLAMIARYWKEPRPRTASVVAGVLVLGLLTKAYFIALIPALLAPCLILRRWNDAWIVPAAILVAAGPWYVRNILRYGVVTGMQESRAGIGPMAVLAAAPALNWPRVAFTGMRAALWTGNNSFLSFSSHTETVIAIVWLIALILWAITRHQGTEWIAAGYCVLFLIALAYVTVVSYLHTGGAASGPSPWYPQVLLAPALGFAFLGCSRSGRLGGALSAILVGLFGYVLIATYLVKFIPLYGGYEGRTSLAALTKLYSQRLPMLWNNLDLICLAPVSIVLSLIAIVTALAIAQILILTRSQLARRVSRPAASQSGTRARENSPSQTQYP